MALWILKPGVANYHVPRQNRLALYRDHIETEVTDNATILRLI